MYLENLKEFVIDEERIVSCNITFNLLQHMQCNAAVFYPYIFFINVIM